MNDTNSILLISDDDDFSHDLVSKLIFLRKKDVITCSKFANAVNNVTIHSPAIVLVHSNIKTAALGLIEELRKNKDLCIIFVSDLYDSELILQAYESGADDFILSSAESFEFVLRIVHNIKQNSVKLSLLKNLRILEQLQVIEPETGVYNFDYAKQVIENYIDDNLIDCGIFMVFAPVLSDKIKFSSRNLAKVIKNTVRFDDIVTFGKGEKVYLFLAKKDLNDALVVFNKIKENYKDTDICTGISSIVHKQFDRFELEALQALSNAQAMNLEYSFADEKSETLDNWLDDGIDVSNGYKIFRQMFNKKLEKVIAPVFYRLQKSYEERLFDTEIEQYTNEEQCVFKLKNKKQESTLKIVYPGFTKIIVYITHEGLDSPENKDIQIPLTKITQKDLVKIVEDFIKEFKIASV